MDDFLKDQPKFRNHFIEKFKQRVIALSGSETYGFNFMLIIKNYHCLPLMSLYQDPGAREDNRCSMD